MLTSVQASYRHCRRLSRKSSTSFYYSFLVLPRPKRWAMCALYAFLRHTDDLGDNSQGVDQRRRALAAWRTALDRALAGDFQDRLFPALADTISRFRIEPDHLHTVIEGVEMDPEPQPYETFEDLTRYCHKVASVVGLCCIHIWGYRGEAATQAACKCGLAFQLTNILRDLKEDAAVGRIYLPREDLRRFELSDGELLAGRCDERFRALVRFEVDRAEQLYREGAALAQWLEPDGRACFGAMLAVYRDMLEQIKLRGGDVFSRPVRLSRWRKLKIAVPWLLSARTWLPARSRSIAAGGASQP